MPSLAGCVRVTVSAGSVLKSCSRRRCTGLVVGDGQLCQTHQIKHGRKG
jgi:hypothetical protein